MPRKQLWTFDSATIDFEDRDVSVIAIHAPSLTQVCIRFRVAPSVLKGDVATFRQRIECLATDKVLDLASFLDSFG